MSIQIRRSVSGAAQRVHCLLPYNHDEHIIMPSNENEYITMPYSDNERINIYNNDEYTNIKSI